MTSQIHSLPVGALVRYKNAPARIQAAGKKLTIELPGGETLSVRPKDVTLLHPGPLARLADLTPPQGEVEAAWELLSGGTTHLAELAELVYGDVTPRTAWAAWQLVEDGLYFEGTPEKIAVRSAQAVVQERAAREARAAEQRAWRGFLERVRTGMLDPAQDGPYLQDVEALAWGATERSAVLRALNRPETPQDAHALLLDVGHWDPTVVPYPRRLGLPVAPPSEALPPLPDEPRLDLTHLPAFAIDDEGNRDPDDALSLDGRRLWVHVADVAALVPPDTAADVAARARGATLYLPDGPVPMLPAQVVQVLGMGLAEVSPALSFGLDLDDAGQVTGVEVVPSWVRVTRMTYAEAEACLEQEPFAALYRLAVAHQTRRREAGAVELDLPEVKITVEEGAVSIRPLPPLRSRDVVREAMVMAGAAVGRFALEHAIPLPFSSQPPPDTDDRPTDLAGMFTLRRQMKPAQYSSRPGPHAGLGMALYVQATSPLRRYLDLVVHQQLRAYLRGAPLLDEQALTERVGATEAVVGSVRRAERQANAHWTLIYLMQHPGWCGEGFLVEKWERRGKVLIPELDWEAAVHVPGDPPLNSTVSLVLLDVNLATLEAFFRVA
ncbi:MAG: RNB domain-containing ribonuclease [Anaerolineae bacterium]|nr:RNB domain-containing ribonuclease [Anaerolineae bacterium]